MEDGSFAGFRTESFVCLEYPGFVKNVDKALETLRGEENISNCYRRNVRIPLTYRPKDQFAHAMYTTSSDTKNILVRIKRRRKKSTNTSENCNPWIHSTECLGIIHKTYRFDSLMDYQFLAPKSVQDSCSTIRGTELFTDEQPMFLPPHIFSRSEQCGPYNYSQNPFVKDPASQVVQRKNSRRFGDTEVRQARPNWSCLFYNTDDPIPTEAKKELTDAMASFTNLQMDLYAQLVEMFNRRPMWSKTAAMYETNSVKITNFNPVLSCVAYYWMKGPWRTIWCRIGYDPRKDPEARNYQPIEWRPRPFHFKKVTNKFVLNMWKRFTENSKKFCKKSDDGATPYVFDGAFLPENLQGTVQLCDINMEEVKQIICDEECQLDSFDKTLGWMTNDSMKEIRSIVTKRCFNLLHKLESQKDIDGNETTSSSSMNDSYVQKTVDEIINSNQENHDDDDDNDDDDHADDVDDYDLNYMNEGNFEDYTLHENK